MDPLLDEVSRRATAAADEWPGRGSRRRGGRRARPGGRHVRRRGAGGTRGGVGNGRQKTTKTTTMLTDSTRIDVETLDGTAMTRPLQLMLSSPIRKR
eukprot:SAG11_NODE_16354_length_549_cov_16.520000_1_plen_96_part_10